MRVIQGFCIIFRNGKSVFTAREHVTGEVLINLSEPLKVKNVDLTLRGHSKATRSGNLQQPGNQDKTKLGQAVNEYLYTQLQLTAGSSSTLPAGQNRLPFSFVLPEGLPTSFESRHCRIRYWLEAVITRTSWFKSKRRTTLQGFTVIEHIDVNQPDLLSPWQTTKGQTLGLICKKSLQIIATLHRKGYCPGESLVMNMEIANGTKRSISSQAALVQKIEYRIKGRKYNDSVQISTMELGSVARTQTQSFNNYAMPIPSIAPTISSCKLITVSYALQVTVRIGNDQRLTFEAPVVIGTIPLRQPAPQFGHLVPQSNVQGFSLDIPPSLDGSLWSGNTFGDFGPPLSLAPEPPSPSMFGAPPKYPGGPSPSVLSAPSAPPLSQYDSGTGVFIPPPRTSLTPLKNAPDLPEIRKASSESRISPCPAMRPSSIPNDTSSQSGRIPPPVARKPSSSSNHSCPSTPTIPNGRALVLPKLHNQVKLKPVRAAPTKIPGGWSGPPDPPSTPPPNITPKLHVFEETSTSGENAAHAYAECIFGPADLRDEDNEGFDDDADQDPDNYTYVPIYAWAMPTAPPPGT